LRAYRKVNGLHNWKARLLNGLLAVQLKIIFGYPFDWSGFFKL